MRDEVMILLGTFGACALLILGVLELLWPSQRRAEQWSARRPGSSLTRSRNLPQEPSRDRLSVLAVVGQQQIAREPRNRATRVADLR